MAENVAITPGTGATVATDEVTINATLVQVQRVKLVESTEGSGAELTKREDDAHVSGDPGIVALGVRKDTAAALAGADSDYTPFLSDASGRLWTSVGLMPAAADTTDSIAAAIQSGLVKLGLVSAMIKKFKANVAASTTDASLVAAVASKKLRALDLRLHAGPTATNVTLNSKPAGAGTAISPLYACGANGGRSDSAPPGAYEFETVSGEGLSATTGAGSTVGIGGSYIEV